MPVIGAKVVQNRTVKQSAQGLAEHLHEAVLSGVPQVIVSRDSRPQSERLTQSAASVLAANGIRVVYFDSPRSAAELSFAVRRMGASAGVMVLAAGEPPADDRLECYWTDGGRVLDPDSSAIADRVGAVEEVRDELFDDAVAAGRIRIAEPRIHEDYLAAVSAESLNQQRGLTILFSPLFGAGEHSVFPVLKRAGFEQVDLLASQRVIQEGVPTPPHRIPDLEYRDAYDPAIAEATRKGHDLVFVSNPDATRLGAAVRSSQGDYGVLTGGQIAALIADYVLSTLSEASQLEPRHYIINSPIGTDMLRRLAGHYGVHLHGDIPVGFKFMAREIEQARPNFVFAADESRGYLRGTYARERDAAVAALLLAERAAALKLEGRTLLDEMDALYVAHGYHAETTLIRRYESLRACHLVFRQLADRPPEQVGGTAVEEVFDYERGAARSVPNDQPVDPAPEFIDRLLLFRLANKPDGYAAHPSETEPVLNLRVFAFGECARPDCLSAVKAETESKLQAMFDDLDRWLDAAEERLAAAGY